MLTRKVLQHGLAAFAGNGCLHEFDGHVNTLLKRDAGEIDLFESAKKAQLRHWNGLEMDEQANLFSLPIHRFDYSSCSFRWTADVFNPQNRECRLSCYERDQFYLDILVSRHDFRPYDVDLGPLPDWDSCRQRYDILAERICLVAQATNANLVFGTPYSHLAWFCYAEHFGYKRGRSGRLEDFFWPFLMLPSAPATAYSRTEEAMSTVRALRHDPRHPHRGMYVRTLPNLSPLIYVIEDFQDDDEVYADALRLESIHSLRVRQTPLVHSWDEFVDPKDFT